VQDCCPRSRRAAPRRSVPGLPGAPGRPPGTPYSAQVRTGRFAKSRPPESFERPQHAPGRRAGRATPASGRRGRAQPHVPFPAVLSASLPQTREWGAEAAGRGVRLGWRGAAAKAMRPPPAPWVGPPWASNPVERCGAVCGGDRGRPGRDSRPTPAAGRRVATVGVPAKRRAGASSATRPRRRNASRPVHSRSRPVLGQSPTAGGERGSSWPSIADFSHAVAQRRLSGAHACRPGRFLDDSPGEPHPCAPSPGTGPRNRRSAKVAAAGPLDRSRPITAIHGAGAGQCPRRVRAWVNEPPPGFDAVERPPPPLPGVVPPGQAAVLSGPHADPCRPAACGAPRVPRHERGQPVGSRLPAKGTDYIAPLFRSAVKRAAPECGPAAPPSGHPMVGPSGGIAVWFAHRALSEPLSTQDAGERDRPDLLLAEAPCRATCREARPPRTARCF